MMDNHVYNLMRQMTEEHTSLWRIKNEYLKDSDGCEECKSFWAKMEKDKESRVKELGNLIKKHV